MHSRFFKWISAVGVVLTFFIQGCVNVDDKDGMVSAIKYYYINQTKYAVKISAKKSFVPAQVIDNLILAGDTVQFWNYTFRDALTGPFGSPEESTQVKLDFIGQEPKYLVFSGPTMDSSDIRSGSSYYEYAWHDNQVNKYFIISAAHYQRGISCR